MVEGGIFQKIRICLIVKVKLWGAYDNLRQAWSMGTRKVILKMDSLDDIQVLLCSTPVVPLYVVAQYVKQFIQNQWEVKIQHSNREGNRVTNALAKQVFSWELGFYKFMQPPNHVLKLIHDDLEGLTRIE